MTDPVLDAILRHLGGRWKVGHTDGRWTADYHDPGGRLIINISAPGPSQLAGAITKAEEELAKGESWT